MTDGGEAAVVDGVGDGSVYIDGSSADESHDGVDHTGVRVELSGTAALPLLYNKTIFEN